MFKNFYLYMKSHIHNQRELAVRQRV